ncbi:MAG: right-handed parallel beta-helix repeat-containing protein, partial [Prevotella sp.]|nr:right-handed parallel beta-helix repeat-containing protein [Prevotella sp.]
MLKKTIIYIMPLIALLISACAEDDSFTTSPSKTLTFSTDSIDFDTLFSRVPSSTRTFWIYNNSGKNIRCSNIRLENGNQTGFRVNVNGIYLGKEQGFQMYNEEIRNKDSIRVFVEITPPDNGMPEPQHIKDHLVFMLESGVRQEVRFE